MSTTPSTPLRELMAARAHPPGLDRIAALRSAGEAVAERLRLGGVDSLETLDLGTIALESHSALAGWRAPFRIVPARRRAWLVRAGGRRVLVDPATEGAFRSTPFGERLLSRHPLRARALGLRTLDDVLASVGASAGEIDLVLLTHLRFVAVTELLAALPNARIVASDREWALQQAPPPWERPFRERTRPPRSERLVGAPGDVEFDGGLVYLSTPGLTEGTASVVASVGRRLRVFSANGLCPDAWTPYESKLSGLRESVRLRDVEVVPRGDAANAALASESMTLERALSDREGPWHTIDTWAELLAASTFLRASA